MIDPEVLRTIDQRRMLDRIKQQKAIRQIAAKDSLAMIGERDQISGRYQIKSQTGIINANGIKTFNAQHKPNQIVESGFSIPSGIDGSNTSSSKAKRASKGVVSGTARERIKSDGLGDRGQNNGYINGQKWNFPEEPEDPGKGCLMWLDSNWLWRDTQNFKPVDPDGLKFFLKALKYFLKNSKTIYTLNEDDNRIFYQDFVEVPYRITLYYPPLLEELNEYEIIQVSLENIEDIKGFFFMPLLNQETVITDDEFEVLKKVAKKYGLMFSGEWDTWTEYDRRALTGLGIRDTVKIIETTDTGSIDYSNIYQIKNSKFGIGTFEGDANNQFEGLRTKEKIVNSITGSSQNNKVFNDPVFALFQIN